MDQRPLDVNRRYLLKHTSHTVPACGFLGRSSRGSERVPARAAPITLRMNDIGAVSLHLLRPIAVDLYRDNRSTGALILIDPETNATVAAGMVTAAQGQAVAGEEDEPRRGAA
jgi:sulfate adenylyltransferase subunit 1